MQSSPAIYFSCFWIHCFTYHGLPVFPFPFLSQLSDFKSYQPLIAQDIQLRKMREVCHFNHRYTSTIRDRIMKKNPGNYITGFLKNILIVENKYLVTHQTSKISGFNRPVTFSLKSSSFPHLITCII